VRGGILIVGSLLWNNERRDGGADSGCVGAYMVTLRWRFLPSQPPVPAASDHGADEG
jgi:hypothetical protein